ncbi:chorismate-binding protein [Cellulophaga baltica]|uniref:Isochorismate synthase n=1 Tax=Cellulophaga baltica 18 TaxID=1348584 RepID=A0AAU8RHZ2_9FLAO|nr:chorismate-binding protein [Cellulophaga baltica]AIZ42532.1 isochorismate synthase [Cellulophaga baltica 18]
MQHDFFQKAKNHLNASKPFVLYRKPLETTITGLFQSTDALHVVTDFSKTGFVFAPFDSDGKTILLQVDEKTVTEYIAKEVNSATGIFKSITEDQDQEFHINLVQKGIDAIAQYGLRKVVLSRKIEVKTSKSAFTLFKTLLDNYSNAFCYLWYHPKVGLWLGATPEILLRTENRQLKTMSLAGTNKAEGAQAPVWGAKELEEQQMVTDYIASSLKETVSKLTISETESVRAGNLWHLRTSVSGGLSNYNLKEIIAALHPTPAVCGLPKKEAKAFILENENYTREFYTGFLGELNFKEENFRSSNRRNRENQAYRTVKNTTSLYVNLRCMQLKDDKAWVYVGGGITQESDPEKEWEETVAKSNTMLKVVL